MKEDNIYDNLNNCTNIKKIDINLKEKFNKFAEDTTDDELSILNLTKNEINNIFSEQEKNNTYFSLTNNENIVGLYYLNKSTNHISFLIKKSERNKGYGKLGLHLLLQLLYNLYPDISSYNFKLNKNNLYALLIVLGNNATIISSDEKEYQLSIPKDNNLWMHKVSLNNMDQVMQITNQAKELLKKNGSLQWQQGYPNEETFKTDIKNDALYGLYENKNLVGFGSYIFGKDENYVDIDGKWEIPANDKDMAIHRIAVSENSRGKKYGGKILNYGIYHAKNHGCVTVKVDTHEKNIPMQKTIIKIGFQYKGIIKILTEKLDNSRFAYEYVLSK